MWCRRRRILWLSTGFDEVKHKTCLLRKTKEDSHVIASSNNEEEEKVHSPTEGDLLPSVVAKLFHHGTTEELREGFTWYWYKEKKNLPDARERAVYCIGVLARFLSSSFWSKINATRLQTDGGACPCGKFPNKKKLPLLQFFYFFLVNARLIFLCRSLISCSYIYLWK